MEHRFEIFHQDHRQRIIEIDWRKRSNRKHFLVKRSSLLPKSFMGFFLSFIVFFFLCLHLVRSPFSLSLSLRFFLAWSIDSFRWIELFKTFSFDLPLLNNIDHRQFHSFERHFLIGWSDRSSFSIIKNNKIDERISKTDIILGSHTLIHKNFQRFNVIGVTTQFFIRWFVSLSSGDQGLLNSLFSIGLREIFLDISHSLTTLRPMHSTRIYRL